MDTISNYVDSVFEKLPNTPELLEQKQAMLTKMQDKYNPTESRRKKRARGNQQRPSGSR
ncbi:hypothetical protein SDC9_139574 [bioreactor metagenome]|jgi:hypothetical protein|uniref:Uncharacterized protein n=1 Tax=bioreactor metagenome TaxID=1076179 RepID=A0A645DT29_9ZZZZ